MGRYRPGARSEEHTSELQSHSDLVCRLLLEKKRRMTGEVSRGKTLPVFHPRGEMHNTLVTGEVSRGNTLPVFHPSRQMQYLIGIFLKEARPPESSTFPPPAAFPF